MSQLFALLRQPTGFHEFRGNENKKSRLAFLFLAFYCGFLFFYRLGDRDLTSSHEARAAQHAQMMLSEGCWGLPRLFSQKTDLQKPPLYYWLVAVLAWCQRGEVDSWAVRLPAALSGLGCVLAVCWFGFLRRRPLMGWGAALILATCLHFTWLARVGRIDMPLTFTISLALLSFFHGQLQANIGEKAGHWFFLGYLAVALAIMLKGPIGALLPGAVMAMYGFCLPGSERRPWPIEPGPKKNQTLLFSLWWGIPLIFLLAGPWFIWANHQTENRLWEVFFWHHNLERGLGGSTTLAEHPWWYYGPRLAIDCFPWSLILAPLVLWFLFKNFTMVGRVSRPVLELHNSRMFSDGPGGPSYHGEKLVCAEFTQGDAETRFGLVWFGTIFVLLSCLSFKRADYLLPAYPGLAIFLGGLGERWWLSRRASSTAKGVILLGVVVYGLGWGIYLEWARASPSGRPDRLMAREIRQRTSYPVIFFRTEAHALAFYVGQPQDTILEWENLDHWASLPVPIYVVMPTDCAEEWPNNLRKGNLVEVLRSTDLVQLPQERPLVLLRTNPSRPNQFQ